MKVFLAALSILKCCQKDILDFSYSTNITHQRNMFPYSKTEPDIHYHPCLVLHSGVSTVIQIARNVALSMDTLLAR